MNHVTTIAGAIAFTLLPTAAGAQVGAPQFVFNELYVDHDGTDDQEYVEIMGVPGSSMDGLMVLVVEGEGLSAGTLDRAWDLTGGVMPSDGFYVLGDSNVVGIDYDIGASNRIENGTETFYLLLASDPASVAALVGSNVDGDGDGVTDLVGMGSLQDLVALVDSGYDGTPTGDQVFDGALALGPDGAAIPAGVFRPGDYPSAWCGSTWLDRDDGANVDQPRTPGASNTALCAGSPGGPGMASCFGDGTTGPCPCGNTGGTGEGCAHSEGMGMTVTGSGTASVSADDLVLTVDQAPGGNAGAFFASKGLSASSSGVFDGLDCLSAPMVAFHGRYQAAGTVSDTGFVAQEGTGTWFLPGETVHFQYLSRDLRSNASPCGTLVNLSPVYTVTYTP